LPESANPIFIVAYQIATIIIIEGWHGTDGTGCIHTVPTRGCAAHCDSRGNNKRPFLAGMTAGASLLVAQRLDLCQHHQRSTPTTVAHVQAGARMLELVALALFSAALCGVAINLQV
jgi:hypothetical protein